MRDFLKMRLPLILGVYILVQPLLDVLTAPAADAGAALNVGVVVRTAFMAFAFLYVVFLSRFRGKGFALAWLGGLAVYLVLFMGLMLGLGGLPLCVGNLKESVKVLYAPVTVVFLAAVYREHGQGVPPWAIGAAGCLYAGVILLAYLTGTSRPAYPNSGYGYGGWFYAANEVGCIIAVSAPIAICLFLKRLWGSGWWKGRFMAVGVVSLLFAANYIGTKIVFGAVAAYCGAALIWCLARTRWKEAAVMGVMTALVVLMFFPSPLNSYLQEVYLDRLEAPSDTQEEVETDGLWLRDALEENELLGTVDRILSRRLYTAAPPVQVYLEGSLPTKLLGIGYEDAPGYGHSVASAIELDGLSILVRHGVVGFLLCFAPVLAVVLWFICDFLRRPGKRLASLEYCSCLFSVLAAFGVSLIAGHVLTAPAVSTVAVAVGVELWRLTK